MAIFDIRTAAMVTVLSGSLASLAVSLVTTRCRMDRSARLQRAVVWFLVLLLLCVAWLSFMMSFAVLRTFIASDSSSEYYAATVGFFTEAVIWGAFAVWGKKQLLRRIWSS
jgi:hypothetical protein